MKTIYIIRNSKGWVIVSETGEQNSGYFATPNEALEIARALAQSLSAEIIIDMDSDLNAHRRKLGNDKNDSMRSAA